MEGGLGTERGDRSQGVKFRWRFCLGDIEGVIALDESCWGIVKSVWMLFIAQGSLFWEFSKVGLDGRC